MKIPPISPSLGTTAAGTIVFTYGPVDPWPPPRPAESKMNLDDGYLQLKIGVGRRIYASLHAISEGTETELLHTNSCRLYSDGAFVVTVAITWNDDINIYVNNMIAGSTAQSISVPRRINLPPWKPPTTPGFDFSSKNANALTSRQKRYLKLQEKSGTRFGGAAYLSQSLRDEAAQLKDLLRLVHNGSLFHVRGIASRLRLLLLRDGQDPLLGMAAAVKNLPLICYTASNPKQKIPLEPTFQISANISPIASGLYFNPVDIDVWLGLASLQIGSTSFSNEKLIADLGNTIGSHLDVNVLPQIDALRQLSHFDEGNAVDQLSLYVVQVATAVLALCEFVQSNPEGP